MRSTLLRSPGKSIKRKFCRVPAAAGLKAEEYVGVKLNVRAVTTAAGEPNTEARKQSTDVPQPGRLLQGCTAQTSDTPVDVKASMESDFYLVLPSLLGVFSGPRALHKYSAGRSSQEVRAQPRLCNAQLRIAAATEEELAKFPARLPAADAAALSPVLRTRLTNWEGAADSGAMAVCTLQLQVGISQQLLDAVVGSVYAQQLSVGPETAESLLLLADYLQLDWLTKTVAAYLKQHVLSSHPLALCQLSRQYASLGLFQAAAARVLERLQPQELAALVQLGEAADRARVFKAVSKKALPPQCLEFLCRLCDAGGSHQPSAEELHAATRRHPELAVALLQRTHHGLEHSTDYEALWQAHYATYHTVRATGSQAAVVCWAVPLKRLHEAGGALELSSQPLQTSGGRSFEIKVCRSRGRRTGRWHLGLYARPSRGTVWREGDMVVISAMRSASQAECLIDILDDDVGTSRPLGDETLVDEFAQADNITICGGAYLPVRVQLLPAK